MAAAENRQPAVTPGFHRSGDSHANANGKHQDVIQDSDTHADQGANSRSLRGLGLGILLDKEQHQTYNGNAASQYPPAKAAVVHNLGFVFLSHTTVGANRCPVINLLSAVSAKCHRNPSLSLFSHWD